jgi:hypothetical protein
MASIFCPSCGSKSEYKFATPNFCFRCGNPYSSVSSLKKTSATINSPEIENAELDEDEDLEDPEDFEEFSNSTRVPRISKLQVEVDSTTDVRVFKFENIAENSTSPFKRSKNLNIDNIS